MLPSHPRRIRSAERRRQCLELRKSGMTFAEIGAAVGISTPGAYTAVKVALDKMLEEPARQVRAMEICRLDKLFTSYWDSACSGNLEAAEMVLKIMEKRARYLGLYAPVEKVISGDLNVNATTTIEALNLPLAIRQEILRAIEERNPGTFRKDVEPKLIEHIESRPESSPARAGENPT